jgi:hypothetical protein
MLPVSGYFVRQAWALRFGLTDKQMKELTCSLMWQLCRCRSDEARRIILGISN